MIYELALLVQKDVSEDGVKAVNQIVHDVIDQMKGELLIEDAWGRVGLPQPTTKGETSGTMNYYIFVGGAELNAELTRRFRINEGVLRHMIIKLGESEERENIVKKYRTPFSKRYKGSALDEMNDKDTDADKDRRRFVRKKSCWFTAKKISADWKDPQTFSWLINEFGKITPARISGISRKHQRLANRAIKRARQIGVASYLSGKTAQTL